MHQVITADRQAVTVAGYNPYIERRVSEFQACCNRGRTPMNGVEAIGLNVVGKAGCATDAGYSICSLTATPSHSDFEPTLSHMRTWALESLGLAPNPT